MSVFHKLGVLLRPRTPSLKAVYEDFRRVAFELGFEVILEKNSAEMIGAESSEFCVDFHAMCEQSDILVSIGGDGTLISLMRRASAFNKPIFGVNMGRLGFLTSIKINDAREFLQKIKNNDFSLRPHLLLGGEIMGKKSQNLRCVNEFLITKKDIAGMISVEAKINGKFFNKYRCDGLIVGTPTGSSAYNISAGGSIIYPHNRNVLLTPICAHSLTQKPLVLSDEFALEFSLNEGSAQIITDGQEIIDFNARTRFLVKALKENAYIIYEKERDYFAVLREKFGWGE